ncbi:MAG: type II toxin-antitoxin system prevent-host-death family antitoxin [Acidobacteriota bacterium]
MNTVSYTALRKNLASVMDQVNDDHAPIIVTRQKGRPAVLMSLEDFRAYEETLYLMRSPRNSKRLDDAIEELRRGDGKQRKLAE